MNLIESRLGLLDQSTHFFDFFLQVSLLRLTLLLLVVLKFLDLLFGGEGEGTNSMRLTRKRLPLTYLALCRCTSSQCARHRHDPLGFRVKLAEDLEVYVPQQLIQRPRATVAIHGVAEGQRYVGLHLIVIGTGDHAGRDAFDLRQYFWVLRRNAALVVD